MWPPVSRWTRRPPVEAERLDPVAGVLDARAAARMPGTSISSGKCPTFMSTAPSARSGRSAAVTTSGAPVAVIDHVGAPSASALSGHGEAVEQRLEPRHRVELDDGDLGERIAEMERRPRGRRRRSRRPVTRLPFVERFVIRMYDSTVLWPDRVPVLGELLDRAVVDHEHRHADLRRAAARAASARTSSPRCPRAAPRTAPRASGRRGRRRCRAGVPAGPRAPRAGRRRARPGRTSAPRPAAPRGRPGSRAPPAGSCSGCRGDDLGAARRECRAAAPRSSARGGSRCRCGCPRTAASTRTPPGSAASNRQLSITHSMRSPIVARTLVGRRRLPRGRRRTCPHQGSMFWFSRKTFVGSHSRFSATSRS